LFICLLVFYSVFASLFVVCSFVLSLFFQFGSSYRCCRLAIRCRLKYLALNSYLYFIVSPFVLKVAALQRFALRLLLPSNHRATWKKYFFLNRNYYYLSVSSRFNLSQLEDWVRVNQLEGSGIVEALEAITQATQLLQVNKKTLEDVDAICEVCASLNTLQVQHTPFLRKIVILNARKT